MQFAFCPKGKVTLSDEAAHTLGKKPAARASAPLLRTDMRAGGGGDGEAARAHGGPPSPWAGRAALRSGRPLSPAQLAPSPAATTCLSEHGHPGTLNAFRNGVS